MRGERGRHAAPRTPLLRRLPAGKAVALAAMPTAVLMGMGFTPQLAMAKPLPKDMFRAGPCLEVPDREPSAPDADEDADGEEAGEEAGERAATPDGSRTPSAPDVPDAPERPEPSAPPREEPDTAPSPSPSPSPTDGEKDEEEKDERHPLDPLGLGDALGDLLGGGDDGRDGKPASEPAPGTPGPSAEPGPSDEPDEPDEPEDTGVPARPKPDPAGTPAPEEPPATEPSPPSSADTGAGTGADGGKPFPCPEEKKVTGADETTPAVLPDQPWRLESTRLALHGLDYQGVVNLRTADGSTKQALKFTAASVDIRDLHQIVRGPRPGLETHVRSDPGSTSTIRDGQVTLYTEKLEGRLFGLVPIVFDPEHEPPLDLPEVFFTDVTIEQAGQFGGDLTVPGLRQDVERAG